MALNNDDPSAQIHHYSASQETRNEAGDFHNLPAPEHSQMLHTSNSHQMFDQDPSSCPSPTFKKRRENHKNVGQIREAVSSDTAKDDQTALFGSDIINHSSQGDEDCDVGARNLELHKPSKLLEASTDNITSSSGDKCHDQDEKVNMLNKQTESDDSEVEEDVKVCDICGDTGREDLLAVCSRCSDGAEHTYCMREMLDEVPEGEWLCEECKCNEELEARKHDHSKKVGTIERSKLLVQTSSLHSDLSLKSDIKDPFSERSKFRNVSLTKQASSKRIGERIDSGPTSKKLALESSLVSPKSSSPKWISALSKDTHFHNLDKMKNKLSSDSSAGTESSGDSPTRNSHHVMKGSFLKSNSFSSSISRQNLKVPEDFQNQKQGIDAKDGPGKVIGKSMSFKGLGRSSTCEPKVKMLSTKRAPVQDLKGLKNSRDRPSIERKNMNRLDHSLPGQVVPNSGKRPSRGADGLLNISVTNNRDHRNIQAEGKLNNLSKQAGHVAQKFSEGPAGLGDAKRQSPTGAVVSASINGTGYSTEAKLNNSFVKDGPTHHARTADRSHSGDGLDSQIEKAPENSTVRSRQGLNGGVTGNNRRGLSSDASAAKSKEGLHEENRLKAAIEAAMQKKQDIFKKNKIPDKSSDLPSSNTPEDRIGDACAYQLKDSISERAVHEGDTVFYNSATPAKHINVYPSDSAKAPIGKTPLGVSSIPEQDSVWQGAFEIHRAGKLPDLCGGFQAHMSIVASGNVFETVRMLPQKIVFNEVPRPCAWPVHFKELGAREDQIALYFFAKDIESYIRSYKILVEYMMKHDLALRGIINGVELLVFPSNHLPHQSQCWNALYFMWGVFRGRRSHCSDERFDSLGSNEQSVSDTVLRGKDLASTEDPCSGRPAVDYLSVSGSDHIGVPGREAPVVIQQCSSLSNGDCQKECLTSPTNPDNYEKRPKNHDSGLREACSLPGTAAMKNGVQERLENDIKKKDVKDYRSSVDGVQLKSEAGLKQGGHVADSNTEASPSILHSSRINSHEDSNESTSVASSMITCIKNKRPWVDRKDTSEDKEETHVNKRLKESSSFNGCNLNNDPSFGDKLEAQASAVNTSCQREDASNDPSSTNPASAEGRFFLANAHPALENHSGDPLPRKMGFSANEDRLPDGSPNLELALGVTKKQGREGVLPFFTGLVDRRDPDRVPDIAPTKEEDGDGSASLSLSLGFPFPVKETMAKPEELSRTEEQPLPGRHGVNTSLLLFRGSLD